MIRQIKREQVHTHTETTVVCDLCGAEARDGEWGNRATATRTEVTLSVEEKTQYPDYGFMKGTAYDCCPACFKDKVQPALEALGLKPRATELDW